MADPVRLDIFQTIRALNWEEDSESESESEATGSELVAPLYFVVQATMNARNAGPAFSATPFTLFADALQVVFGDNADDIPPGIGGDRTNWLRPGAPDPGAEFTVMSIGATELENYYAIALTGLSAVQDSEDVGNQAVFFNIRAMVEDGVLSTESLEVEWEARFTGSPSGEIGLRIQVFQFAEGQTSVSFGTSGENPSGAISGGQILWRLPSGSQTAIATTLKGIGPVAISPFGASAEISLESGTLI